MSRSNRLSRPARRASSRRRRDATRGTRRPHLHPSAVGVPSARKAAPTIGLLPREPAERSTAWDMSCARTSSIRSGTRSATSWSGSATARPRATRRRRSTSSRRRTSTTGRRGTPTASSTTRTTRRCKLTDPYSYTDPRQYYYTPYVANAADRHESFAQTLKYIEDRRLLDKLPESWHTVLHRLRAAAAALRVGRTADLRTRAGSAYGTTVDPGGRLRRLRPHRQRPAAQPHRAGAGRWRRPTRSARPRRTGSTRRSCRGCAG